MRTFSFGRYLESICFRAIVIATLVIIAALFARSPNNYTSNASAQEQPESSADQQKKAETFWERTTSDPVAAYTGVLAIFTAALVVVSGFQIYFLNRSDQTARIAANAADLSARAAVRMELPWVGIRRPELVGLGGPVPQRGAYAGSDIYEIPVGYLTIMKLGVNNVGRTPARLSSVQAGWFVGERLDPKPKYLVHRNVGGEVVRENGGVTDLDLGRFTIEINNEQALQIRDGQFQFWFFVQLFYSDFMGDMYHPTFCWKWTREDGYAGYCFVRDKYCPPAYAEKTYSSPSAPLPFNA